MESASTEEQFQTVGFLCRDTIVWLAHTVFDPDRHPKTDDIAKISETDAKRMLDRLAFELGGSSNVNARKLAEASHHLANEL